MSKGSQFWGVASGKLGQQVLYRSGGEQRSRTYVAKIKNPKTLAQMKNRLSMLNFATTYRMLKSILSKSFPNRSAKESGFNAFVKANKSIKSAVINRVIANMGLCVPYNMLISQGYLTQFGEFKQITLASNEKAAGFDLSAHPNIAEIRALLGSWDTMDDFPSSLANWQALWDALQLPSDAKFTVVLATYVDDAYSVKSYSFGRELNGLDIWNSPVHAFIIRDGQDSSYKPILTFGGQSSETMVGCIISYTDGNGKLQVTNSRMVVPSNDTSIPDDFVEGGFVYDQVLNEYGYTADSAL